MKFQKVFIYYFSLLAFNLFAAEKKDVFKEKESPLEFRKITQVIEPSLRLSYHWIRSLALMPDQTIVFGFASIIPEIGFLNLNQGFFKTKFSEVNENILALSNDRIIATGHCGSRFENRILELDCHKKKNINPKRRGICKHTNVTSLLALSNGKILSGGDWGSLVLWDFENPVGEYILRNTRNPIYYLTELPGNKVILLYSGFWQESLQVWNFETKTLEKSIKTPKDLGYIQDLIVLTDGTIATAGMDGKIRFWNLKKPEGEECFKVLLGHSKKIHSLVKLGKNRIVSASEDTTIRLWNLNKPEGEECERVLKDHQFPVKFLIVLKDGRLVSVDKEGILKVKDIKNNLKKIFDQSGLEGVLELYPHLEKNIRTAPLLDQKRDLKSVIEETHNLQFNLPKLPYEK